MIHFVVTKHHRYAMQKMFEGKMGRLPFEWKQWSYEKLLSCRKIQAGTWIFQDIERLTAAERMRASKIAARLELNAARVINHPAHASSRYELQRKLFKAGINKFEVYRADEHRTPNRWPVFIRYEANHRSPNPNLIYSVDELNNVLANYIADNIPLSNLLIVEYCGEPGSDGLWRKYSAYRVGNEIIHHHIVRQDSWVAKYGNPSLQFDDETWIRLRTEEKNFVMQQHDPLNLKKAFDEGGLEFGRADFNFVNGKVQIYEINTNPTLGVSESQQEKFPAMPREPTIRHANDRIIKSLSQLDTHNKTKISIADINYIKALPWRPAKRP